MNKSYTGLIDEFGKVHKEIVCKEDEDVFEYKFIVTGQFYGDKDEVINKDRILEVARLTDSNEAWEMLWNADFELYEVQEEE
tara:strand:+ start:1772 stop:2017 length:246 start_codon:yes stop_codon:yes gene_type:complete